MVKFDLIKGTLRQGCSGYFIVPDDATIPRPPPMSFQSSLAPIMKAYINKPVILGLISVTDEENTTKAVIPVYVGPSDDSRASELGRLVPQLTKAMDALFLVEQELKRLSTPDHVGVVESLFETALQTQDEAGRERLREARKPVIYLAQQLVFAEEAVLDFSNHGFGTDRTNAAKEFAHGLLVGLTEALKAVGVCKDYGSVAPARPY
jgi:hypothetical protein